LFQTLLKMKNFSLLSLFLFSPFGMLFTQINCPNFGGKIPKAPTSNPHYLHYGVDVFTLIYADKPWVLSLIPHVGVKAEINLLRHFTVGASAGSRFKLEFNTEVPVYQESSKENLYLKLDCRVFIHKVFTGLWISPALTVDNSLKGYRLLELGFSNKVSKVGVIDYRVGFTLDKPLFLSIGIGLGVLRRR
jgi:hypothetical protein